MHLGLNRRGGPTGIGAERRGGRLDRRGLSDEEGVVVESLDGEMAPSPWPPQQDVLKHSHRYHICFLQIVSE
jgi:hypothetical protein